MEDYIKSMLISNTHPKIYNIESMNKIYRLFVHKELFEPTSTIETFYIGHYYRICNHHPLLMHLYLTSASEQGSVDAIFDLGIYYSNLGHAKLAIAYYKEAILYKHSGAMNNLGWIYYQQKQFVKMEKYYKMAIEYKHIGAMNNLGWYYYEQKQFVEMKMYYFMACDNKYQKSFENLISFYREHNKSFGLLKLYIKYHELFNRRKELIDQFNIIASQQLSSKQEIKFLEIIYNFSFTSEDSSVLKLCNSLRLLSKVTKNNIELIDLHFNYSPTSNGCIQAKKDFLAKCI